MLAIHLDDSRAAGAFEAHVAARNRSRRFRLRLYGNQAFNAQNEASMRRDRRLLRDLGRRPSLFTRLAQAASRWAGKPATFFAACAVIILWAASGPVFGFNDTWQLVINTSTTIITFLMVFIIQNSQNRDTAAIQIKLDELLSKVEGARQELMDLEELDESRLEDIRRDFEQRAKAARGEGSAGATGGDGG